MRKDLMDFILHELGGQDTHDHEFHMTLDKAGKGESEDHLLRMAYRTWCTDFGRQMITEIRLCSCYNRLPGKHEMEFRNCQVLARIPLY
jgi:hypothetical protein